MGNLGGHNSIHHARQVQEDLLRARAFSLNLKIEVSLYRENGQAVDGPLGRGSELCVPRSNMRPM